MNTYYLLRVYYDYKCQNEYQKLYNPIKNEYNMLYSGELTLPLTHYECSLLDWMIKNNLFINSNFTKIYIISYLQIDLNSHTLFNKFFQKEYQTVNQTFTINYHIQDYLAKMIQYYNPQFNSQYNLQYNSQYPLISPYNIKL